MLNILVKEICTASDAEKGKKHFCLMLIRSVLFLASLIRTFMFMGFAVACPGDPIVPMVPEVMYMVYRIDPDDLDDD